METRPTRSFVRDYLPWLVAAGMLLLYLVTLDRTVTVASVPPLARATGADWHLAYSAPLTWLITLPIRWLPSGVQLVGLNFIGALCAALSLALLARSVALLPHDRTALQRDKNIDENAFLNIRLAWVPVVFAVLVCGLQRTFWENAIIGTGESLDLLLFAFSVRCLLEYRVEENNSWLYRMSLVYGVGIANNFAMIAFFPALLVALVWIKGTRFFRFDFLVRMFLLGLAGLSFYLLLPIVQSQSDVASASFWQVLRANLAWQKQVVFTLRRAALFPAVYALVPLVLMGLKWSSSFGDESPLGRAFASGAAVLLHAGLLVFCVYVAFDPPLSPHGIAAQYRDSYGVSFSFLPCYFLGGLVIGYYSGFLLLVFSKLSERARRRPAWPPVINYTVSTIVCGGAVVATAMLVRTNFPRIREATSPVLQEYVRALVKSLPDKPAVVLSDDPIQLHAVGALLGRAATDKYVLAETPALAEPGYHRFLHKRYGDRFPALNAPKDVILVSSSQLMQLLLELNQKQELFYLHPSLGYYFEVFYVEPRGLAYVLKQYPANTVEVPTPGAALIAEQTALWNSLESGILKDLKAQMAAASLKRDKSAATDASYVATCFSRALNYWGVELQRAGRFDLGAGFFANAIALNEYNVSAIINRDANALWRQGHKRMPQLSAEAEEKLKLYRGLDALLPACGPVDEPSISMEFVRTFTQGGLYRQAEQMVRRALSYEPNDIGYQAALANVEILQGRPAVALEQIATIRADPALPSTDAAVRMELMRTEASAYFARGDFARAQKLLQDGVREFPQLDASYNALSQLYAAHAAKLRADGDPAGADRQMTNALKVIENQIQLQPTNANARFTYGNLLFYTHNYDQAIDAFTKVLAMANKNQAALLNRAMANVQAKRWDAAKRDYRRLLDEFTSADFRVYYGLGEVAYQQQDWSAARGYYKKYLRYAPPKSAESQAVRARLEELKKK